MVDWNAVGAIGSASSAFFAGYSIWDATQQRARQARRDLAISVRQDLRAFDLAIKRVGEIGRSGELLLAMADRIAAQFSAQFSPSTKAELTTAMALVQQSPTLLSAWVRGVAGYEEFQALRLELERVSSALQAKVPIIIPLKDMLNDLLRDSLSPEFFRRLFDADAVALFLRQVPDGASAADIELELRRHLSGNAALYYVARYDRAVGIMVEISDIHLELSDAQLQKLAERATVFAGVRSRTEEMRAYAARSAPALGRERTARLEALIDKLEIAISKEQAAAELQRLAAERR